MNVFAKSGVIPSMILQDINYRLAQFLLMLYI